jgi:glycosyltransferase involved in cell wall biosynthesis
MKISVIIPAHNEERYLTRTLEAVRHINYAPFEIIIVDNASNDTTLNIANTFAKEANGVKNISGIKIIEEPRLGVQFAREAGLKAASGEILAFLDADCLPAPDWLSRCANAISRGAVAVSGPYHYYDDGTFFADVALIVQKSLYRCVHALLQWLRMGGVMTFGNSAITRTALEAIGGINTTIKFYGDDTDLVRKLTAVGVVTYDPKMVMKSSARRFKKLGVVKTILIYDGYFFWEMFIKDPYQQIRARFHRQK